MTPPPQVSVCVLTYNQRRYIRTCLESVLAQRHDVCMEILVGDDCSDDGTSEIVAEFAAAHPELIRHLRHSPRIGASGNTQAVLAHASAPLIARLDGDDYWLPGKLLRQLDYLNAHPRCAAVYTNARTVREDGSPLGLFNDVGDAEFDLAGVVRRGNIFNNSSVMFRAQSVAPWLAIAEPMIDYRMHLLHASFGFLGHLGEPLTVYRVNAAGSMVNQANDRIRALYWEALMSVPRNRLTESDIAAGMADFLRRLIFRALRTRRLALITEWAPRVLAASPAGPFKMSLLVTSAVARSAYVELRGRVAGDRTPVLYRH
jgi:glycosyltransferase involved in cell wall biosynthesis